MEQCREHWMGGGISSSALVSVRPHSSDPTPRASISSSAGRDAAMGTWGELIPVQMGKCQVGSSYIDLDGHGCSLETSGNAAMGGGLSIDGRAVLCPQCVLEGALGKTVPSSAPVPTMGPAAPLMAPASAFLDGLARIVHRVSCCLLGMSPTPGKVPQNPIPCHWCLYFL